jgi:hypothetical protein
LVVASLLNNNALSFGDKSSTTFKLVVASIKNKDSKGPTNGIPAKQRPDPKDDPAFESSLRLYTAPIATFIWHEAFDNSLSRHPIMNVSKTTSVPTLNALLISNYLHPGLDSH